MILRSDDPLTLVRCRLAAAKRASSSALTDDEKVTAEKQLVRARHAVQAALRRAVEDVMAESADSEGEEHV